MAVKLQETRDQLQAEKQAKSELNHQLQQATDKCSAVERQVSYIQHVYIVHHKSRDNGYTYCEVGMIEANDIYLLKVRLECSVITTIEFLLVFVCAAG
jgi:hypothetical protein